MGVFSSLLALLGCGNAKEPLTVNRRFAVGQVWAYRTRPNERDSRVIIGKIDELDDIGTVVHVKVTGLKIKNLSAPDGFTTVIIHAPVAEAKLKDSVTELIGHKGDLEHFQSGYERWLADYEEGRAGVFTITVAEIVSTVERDIPMIAPGAGVDRMAVLLTRGVEAAVDLLQKNSHFDPFAVVMTDSGEVRLVTGQPREKEARAGQAEDSLVRGLQRGAAAGEYLAAALVTDARVRQTDSGESTDVIRVQLEDFEAEAAVCLVSYVLEDGEVQEGERTLERAEPVIFVRPSGGNQEPVSGKPSSQGGVQAAPAAGVAGSLEEAEPPIQNLDRVDVLRARKDGGVDLAILASGPLTADPEVQKLLLDKVEAYLGYINSDEFKAEFENPPAEKTFIVISCYGEVDPVIIELVEKMKPWVEENNARIRLEKENDAEQEAGADGGP